jgi:hypothetical protein
VRKRDQPEEVNMFSDYTQMWTDLGLDLKGHDALSDSKDNIEHLKPKPGKYTLVETNGKVAAISFLH